MNYRSTFFLLLLLTLTITSTLAQSSGGRSSSSTTVRRTTTTSSGSAGSCSASCGIIIGSVFGVVCLLFIIGACIRYGGNDTGVQQNQQFINETHTVVNSDPSWKPRDGHWSGHYHGTSFRNAGSTYMNIDLTFHSGRISGLHGHDSIGAFTIVGEYRAQTQRVTFTKAYTGIRNDAVQYCGSCENDQKMSGIWRLPNGDNGTWELSTNAPPVVMAEIAIPIEPSTPVYSHVQPTTPSYTHQKQYYEPTATPSYASNPTPVPAYDVYPQQQMEMTMPIPHTQTYVPTYGAQSQSHPQPSNGVVYSYV